MFRAEPSGEIAPYLAADYWGGQMIGDARQRDLPEIERIPPVQAIFGSESLAISPLEGVVGRQGSLIAKRIYKEGEVFSPEDHPVDSIVIHRKEVLMEDSKKSERLASASGKRNLPLGFVFSNLPLQPNEQSNTTRIVEPPYIYYSGGRMGVVTALSGLNELVYIAKATKLSAKNGRGLGLPWANIEKAPFTIGQTRRCTTKQGAEFLTRINALVVFEREQKRKRVKKERSSEGLIFPEFFSPNQPSAQF